MRTPTRRKNPDSAQSMQRLLSEVGVVELPGFEPGFRAEHLGAPISGTVGPVSPKAKVLSRLSML